MKSRIFFTLLLSVAVGPRFSQAQTADTLGEKRPHAIPEVVVTGTRSETETRLLPMTVTVVGRERIAQAERSSLLPTLAEHVPGLFVTGRGVMGYGVATGAAGQMTLRGIGNGNQSGSPTTGLLVLIDGHPQYMGLMGHPIADAYQSMLAERVEVVRGPASVLYGSNAMGGVVNIVTRKMKEDGVHTDVDLGYGSFNTLHTEAANRVKAGRFTSVVTGSYDRSDGNRPDMDFEQYGGYVKLGCEVGKAWSVWADANLTHFNASNPGPVTAPILDNDSRITRGMTSLALRNDYRRSSGALSFFYNWGYHKIDDGYSPGEEPLDYRFRSRDRMLGVSWYQSATLFEGNRLTVGVDYQHFGGKAWNHYLETGENRTSADKRMDEVAAYVDFRQSLGRWLTLDAGVRVDHHSHVGTEWVPQGGVAFHLPARIELKATVSKGFRFPTIREMYMFPPQNPDLKPERLMNYEIAFSQRLCDGRLTYGVNLYYIDGENMIMRLPVDGRPMNVNTGEVKNYGVECETTWRIASSWTLSANYSYLHMKYPVVAAPEHKLFCGADFARGRWTASTGIQFVAGLYTQVDPAPQTERFVLWNARVNFRVSRSIALYVRGENLLAQHYEINAGFPMPRATVFGGVNLRF